MAENVVRATSIEEYLAMDATEPHDHSVPGAEVPSTTAAGAAAYSLLYTSSRPAAAPSCADEGHDLALYLNKSPMAELLWPLYPAACQSWPLGMLLPVPKTQ
ncbi:hypothetical protein PLESTM_002053000 [Pleodorina starrii]|nr:hypothetical protein PLESTM_002053000 [Pleodorina starrii]